MHEFLSYFNAQQPAMLALLKELVEIESPSDVKAAVDQMSERVATEMGSAGLKVQRIPGQDTGDCVLGEWGSGSAKAVSLLCHMDTVWPLGTTAARPVRIEDGRFYGPGSYDMKAGIVLALTALRGLAALGKTCAGPVRLLCTGDEEIGSHASRALIEKLGQESRLALRLRFPV